MVVWTLISQGHLFRFGSWINVNSPYLRPGGAQTQSGNTQDWIGALHWQLCNTANGWDLCNTLHQMNTHHSYRKQLPGGLLQEKFPYHRAAACNEQGFLKSSSLGQLTCSGGGVWYSSQGSLSPDQSLLLLLLQHVGDLNCSPSGKQFERSKKRDLAGLSCLGSLSCFFCSLFYTKLGW